MAKILRGAANLEEMTALAIEEFLKDSENKRIEKTLRFQWRLNDTAKTTIQNLKTLRVYVFSSKKFSTTMISTELMKTSFAERHLK